MPQQYNDASSALFEQNPLVEFRRVACSPHRDSWRWVACGGNAGLLHFARVGYDEKHEEPLKSR